ncbi:MAG TPA: aminotransferase class I/II-fold pyridoxal phosphate-dependent enzyme, partial [Alphaproteobacteria bacterium]|nr:aminotransferase class I/II-fold pyridoxal phosphate-dependent enzyme [Alphaproteobacteria bacterium]
AAGRRQRTHGDVLHLEVGQPSTAAPAKVIAAAHKALADDLLGYTDACGLMTLRERISDHYAAEYGVSVDPRRIAVTTGSSGAFILSFLAAFEAGDRVVCATPGYPAYRNILQALGVEAVIVETGPETNYQPTPALIDAVEGSLDGLIVASPSNPTGAMIGGEDLNALADYCRGRGMRLISDEIYHGITYAESAKTALTFDQTCIAVNSFSKYFSMTGWRLGWMVAPEDLLRSVECLAQNLFISPPTLSQLACMAAFDCRDELDANVGRYAENRKLLLRELPKAGFDELASADGAFYIYADVTRMTGDSLAFCRRILDETGIAITPGVDFDPRRGNRFVRFSFSGSSEDMALAAERLIAWRKS